MRVFPLTRSTCEAFECVSKGCVITVPAIETPVQLSGPVPARLNHSSLHERVYEQLRTALRSGRFASGEMVTIRGLADMLGTSPMPVREAVRRLVHDNSLEILPNRTMRVPLMSLRRFDELTEVRATLEGRAAGLAAAAMTDAAFAKILEANERMRLAIERRDIPGIATSNQEFHFAIYRTAGSELMLSMIDALWEQSGPYLVSLMQELAVTSDSLSTIGFGHHFEILAAFHSRNAPAAQAAMENDIRDAAVWYRRNCSLEGSDVPDVSPKHTQESP